MCKNKAYIHQTYKKLLYLTIKIITLISIAIYLSLDYHGPSKIRLKHGTTFGFSCLIADDLVVQDYDENGNLWATRGMIIYKLRREDNKFIKVAHVPTGLSVFWLRNFSILRRITIRPECVEMVATKNGNIFVLSAGWIWYLPFGHQKFKRTFKLSHYGIGDQGMRNDGIIEINDSTVFLGEYFRNPIRDKVSIYRIGNKIASNEVAYQYRSGQIRHIHALQEDPYTKKIWILTGDLDNESTISWSDNEFKSIVEIGHGCQLWRATQLIFTKDEVYWGTDTSSDCFSGIYRWNKNTAKTEMLEKLHGIALFGTRLAKGTIVMSVDREGHKNELDNRTHLIIITENNKITEFDCGTWNQNKKGFWFQPAKLRIQRTQGGSSLVITILNQKKIPDGELIIISEDTLRSAVKTR